MGGQLALHRLQIDPAQLEFAHQRQAQAGESRDVDLQHDAAGLVGLEVAELDHEAAVDGGSR